MFDQDKGMADRGCCGYMSTRFFKRSSYVHSDVRFILDKRIERPRSAGNSMAAPLRG